MEYFIFLCCFSLFFQTGFPFRGSAALILRHHTSHVDDTAALVQIDQFDALCIASNHLNIFDRQTDQHPILGNNHQFIVIYDLFDRHHLTISFGRLYRDHPFAATPNGAII